MLNQSPVGRVFHALGDPTRRAILERVSRRPASASELAPWLRVTLAAVVQHLQVLEESGLISTHKAGRVRTCRLRPQGLKVAEQWMAERRAVWIERFARLSEIIEKEEET
jgi:DNA-binding transcriptional ArsR family regulator